MILTKKRAIKYVVELWEWLTDTGKTKRGWPGWATYEEAYEESDTDCPLCDYAENYCDKCPLVMQLGDECFPLGYHEWDNATTSTQRKKYAKLFLEQLRKLQ